MEKRFCGYQGSLISVRDIPVVHIIGKGTIPSGEPHGESYEANLCLNSLAKHTMAAQNGNPSCLVGVCPYASVDEAERQCVGFMHPRWVNV